MMLYTCLGQPVGSAPTHVANSLSSVYRPSTRRLHSPDRATVARSPRQTSRGYSDVNHDWLHGAQVTVS